MTAPDAQNLAQLRTHLAASNGIAALKILSPDAVDEAVRLFGRDGFVVVADVLNSEQVSQLAAACDEVVQEILALDSERAGNRGSHRYSFGGSSMTRSQLHRRAWQMLLELESVDRLVSAIFGSRDYQLRAASGDFCLPGAVAYQRLHADVRDWVSPEKTPFSAFYDPRGQLSIRDLPCPYLAVNFLPQDVTRLNGPTRQIPGTQNSRGRIPALDEEPEWMRLSTVCPVPAGSIMIRDTRAWHGGTPNLTEAVRSIPNLEFYAPWFREPMPPQISYSAFRQLSPRAQERAAHLVLDSSETLDTRTILQAP
jgi:ectoine hydroxylase-related dioxygenase (phytanoyl-CoA dioxygenase family)